MQKVPVALDPDVVRDFPVPLGPPIPGLELADPVEIFLLLGHCRDGGKSVAGFGLALSGMEKQRVSLMCQSLSLLPFGLVFQALFRLWSVLDAVSLRFLLQILQCDQRDLANLV